MEIYSAYLYDVGNGKINKGATKLSSPVKSVLISPS